ncbi:unnamed protein product [Urochloa humidicola]
MERALAKLEEEVAHKRHRKHKGPEKEERTKKPRDDEAMKTKKPKGDEAMEMLVVDAASKEKCGERRKTKLVTWRLSRELLDYLRTKEVMGCIATETPRLLWPNITAELFDQNLREEIAAQFEENREFDAYVLYQYRTKG